MQQLCNLHGIMLFQKFNNQTAQNVNAQMWMLAESTAKILNRIKHIHKEPPATNVASPDLHSVWMPDLVFRAKKLQVIFQNKTLPWNGDWNEEPRWKMKYMKMKGSCNQVDCMSSACEDWTGCTDFYTVASIKTTVWLEEFYILKSNWKQTAVCLSVTDVTVFGAGREIVCAASRILHKHLANTCNCFGASLYCNNPLRKVFISGYSNFGKR